MKVIQMKLYVVCFNIRHEPIWPGFCAYKLKEIKTHNIHIIKTTQYILRVNIQPYL